jgi:hypothetical protein
MKPKVITHIAHGTQRLTNPTFVFLPPPPSSQITFTPRQLFGSVARVKALNGASVGVTQALAHSAEALIREVVDDVPKDFAFTVDVFHLADATRTAFSGDIGAGVSDRYMESLGYIWRDNGRSLVPKGPVADFVYDGPPTKGAGVVITEAKGSVTATATANTIATTTKVGYITQVAPHVGSAPGGHLILHGYALGIASQPGGANSHLHVEETAPVTVGTASAPYTSGSGGPGQIAPAVTKGMSASVGGGGSAGDGPDDVGPVGQPNPIVALGNYRVLFVLASAPHAASAIDVLRSGRELTRSDLPPQLFMRIEAGSAAYLVGMDPGGRHYGNHFAIRESVALAFLGALGPERRLESLRFDLPIMRRREIEEARSTGDVVLYPDGFALLGAKHRDLEKDLEWVPSTGKLIGG